MPFCNSQSPNHRYYSNAYGLNRNLDADLDWLKRLIGAFVVVRSMRCLASGTLNHQMKNTFFCLGTWLAGMQYSVDQ
jgi:hypothetical protein